MSLQVDGSSALDEQERQLRSIETFFVEVIDYDVNEAGNNDVTTKPATDAPPFKLHLPEIQSAEDLTQVTSTARSIIFDRTVLVASDTKRVVGFRS